MYLPAHFVENRPEVLRALVLARPLGLLITQDAAGRLDANPLPFLLDTDPAGGPGVLRGHLARANAVWREARIDRPCMVVFQGPQAYVSPSGYASKREHGKVVPTWNYVMAEARGSLRAIDDPVWVRALVSRLTDRHEATLAAPWSIGDAPVDFVEAMLGAIVGIEIVLDSLVGKWKMSQNRSAADREGVASMLAATPEADARAMADLVAASGR